MRPGIHFLISFLLFPSFFFFSGCGQSEQAAVMEDNPTLESLHQALDAFNAAYARADAASLGRMLTTGYLHTNGANPALDKEEWLNYVAGRKKALNAGELVIDNYALLESRVRLYGKAAVVAGKVRINGLDGGGPFESEFRVTQLWVFEEGGWKRAAFHDGRLK
ncbi:MAG: nuclear transport factor 2 family protein [Phaeodactylibacter sp.]|nr:nuclear transport factor 2 family protein [Phaeodactylibacter sp.]